MFCGTGISNYSELHSLFRDILEKDVKPVTESIEEREEDED